MPLLLRHTNAWLVMSRIEAAECLCMDMDWYAVDRQGNIAVFCSVGEGYLPEFVCEDVERVDKLMEWRYSEIWEKQ